MGFFSSNELLSEAPLSFEPKCGQCGLYKKCKSPKIPVMGSGKKGIMVIGEAPGKDEDRKNMPFVGKAGQFLQRKFREAGADLFRDCYVTNSLICRPPDNKTPDDKKISYCRPNVLRAIEIFRPTTIILCGLTAIKSLIGHYFGKPGKMERWLGWAIPLQDLNVWICPLSHPARLIREQDEVSDLLFAKRLKNALALTGRPWEQVPDYKGQVEITKEPDRVETVLRKMVGKGGSVAFDYETNMLKPESPNSQIVSCSVCWNGKKTIAYPWNKRTRQATRKLLKSKLKKIAANMKFEERWTRAEFGHGVRNWNFDTMLAAHVLDNRREICGLTFQAFVRLGVRPYDTHIKPYLHEKQGYKENRIKEIDTQALLEYNGLDSLLEFKLSELQRRELNVS